MTFLLGCCAQCRGRRARPQGRRRDPPGRLRNRYGAVILGRMTEVTRLLDALSKNDPRAAAELLPLLYDELRQLAAARLAQEQPGQTLDATALVHEVYLRLVGNQRFDGR